MNDHLELNFGKPTIAMIDGNAIVHRAFHALPPLINSRKEPIGALYGFLRVIFKIIREYGPTHLFVAFDAPGPTFRHQVFSDYKATRVKAPESLYQQIPYIKKALEALGITILAKQGFEADDLIGTLSKLIDKPINKLIITGDTDLLQLANAETKIILMQQGIGQYQIFGPNEIEEKYGLEPKQLIELKGLKGDATDNLPGVKGIGDKTGKELIQKFKTLEGVYQNLDKIPDRFKSKLIEQKEEAFMSRQLGTIERNIPIDGSLEKYQWKGYNRKEAIEFLEKYSLRSLIKSLP